MSLTVAELSFVFGADDRQVVKALGSMDAKAKAAASGMDRSLSGFWREETSRATKSGATYQTAGKEAGSKYAKGLTESTGRVKRAATDLFGSLGLGGLGAAAAGAFFIKGGISRLMGIEDAKAKLRGLGHTEQQIAGIMKSALASVKGTAYGMDEAATTAATAVAAGVKPGKELTKYLSGVADAATIAGTNMGEMGSIFNKVQTSGRAFTDNLNQLADRGLPIFTWLQDEYKVSAKGLRKMVSQGKVDAATFEKVIADHIGGAALKSGNTTKGAFKNLEASLNRIAANLLSGFFPDLRKGMGGLTTALGPVEDAATGAGKALGGTVGIIEAIPGPAKAAATALIALRIAGAMGWTDKLTGGYSRLTGATDTLRLRTMLMTDAYRQARRGSIELNGNVGKIVAPAGRASAALSGLKAGAAGFGRGMKGALGGVMGVLGGPWGAALAVGTAAVTYFWQEHAKAQQHIEDVTSSLDEQTGAITDNTRQKILAAVQDSAAVKVAKDFGVSLDLVGKAAMGNRDAQREVNKQVRAYIDAQIGSQRASRGTIAQSQTLWARARTLTGEIGTQNDAIDKARQKWRDHAALMGKSTDAADADRIATDKQIKSYKSLADQITDAKNAIKKLTDAEQKRHDKAVQRQRDAVALAQAESDTRDAVRKATKGIDDAKVTLDKNTQAGRDNWNMLLDLADQWNTSKDKVRNAKGAYADIRAEFVKDADQLGATRKEAQKLADKFLKIPDRKAVNITTPGMQAALANLRALQERAKSSAHLAVYVSTHNADRLDRNTPRAVGGPAFADRPYKVNEVVPEVFVPRTNGRIVPLNGSDMSPGQSGSAGGIDYDRLAAAVSRNLRVTGTLTTPFGPAHVRGIAQAVVDDHDAHIRATTGGNR